MGRRAGPPVVRVHGDQWFARFTVAGRRREVPLGLPASRSRREAQAAAETKRAEAVLAVGSVAPRDADGRERRLGFLVEPYLESVAAAGRDARYVYEQGLHLRSHFLRVDDEGQPTRWAHLDDITAKSIADYQVERREHVGTVTLYKELVTLSRFLRWCKRQGLIDALPEIERPTQTTTYTVPHLSRADVRRLLAALPAHLRSWATFTWLMALRLTESLSLEWRDLDVERGTLTVRAEIDKAGRTWVLPLDEAAAVAKRLRRGQPRERVFAPLTHADRDALVQASVRLGLPRATWHHLRHARISEWANGTRRLASVQFMARHTSIATTGLYVRAGTEAAAEMLREVRRGRERAR